MSLYYEEETIYISGKKRLVKRLFCSSHIDGNNK
jgi:hypothetical protein